LRFQLGRSNLGRNVIIQLENLLFQNLNVFWSGSTALAAKSFTT